MQAEGLEKGIQTLPGLVGASHHEPEQVEEHHTPEIPLSQVTPPNISQSPPKHPF